MSPTLCGLRPRAGSTAHVGTSTATLASPAASSLPSAMKGPGKPLTPRPPITLRPGLRAMGPGPAGAQEQRRLHGARRAVQEAVSSAPVRTRHGRCRRPMNTSLSLRRWKRSTTSPASCLLTMRALRCASFGPKCTDECSGTATVHGPSRWTAISSPSASPAPSSLPRSSSGPLSSNSATTRRPRGRSDARRLLAVSGG